MNKYRNKKVEYDGRKFDSIAEKNRYIELKTLELAGEISNLQCQKKFHYISDKTGKKIFTYIADFVYNDIDGKVHIEDVKGVQTLLFRLKKRFLADEGLEIEIIGK